MESIMLCHYLNQENLLLLQYKIILKNRLLSKEKEKKNLHAS